MSPLVDVRGLHLHVRRRSPGAGVPFVVAHGLMASVDKDLVGEPWIARAEPLADLVLYDARGHGRSDPAPSPDGYAWRELGLDMLALMDALGIERAVLGGGSLGAATAIVAAGLAPERVAGLALVNPPPFEPEWGGRARPALALAASVIRAAGVEPLLAAMESRPENLSTFDRPERWAWEKDLLRARDPARLADLLEGVGSGARVDLAPLARLDAPILLVDREGDADHPAESGDRIAARAREVERVREARWTDPYDRPDERAELLLGFLARVAERERRRAATPRGG
jgi:pimeloyl-ACP methyl ester carboxylesterase